MVLEERCLICGNTKLKEAPSFVAPFVSNRVWKKSPFGVNLLYCIRCDFMFFDLRPDDRDMSALYEDYRGKSYLEERERYEPGTTALHATFHSPEILRWRRNHLNDLLLEIGWRSKNGDCVLDHGGDDGGFLNIQLFTNAKKFVYDLSGVKAADKVVSIRSKEELASYKYSFIMSSNVLEHVSYPLDYLEGLKALSDAGTLFYFEIPIEFARYRFYRHMLWALFSSLGMRNQEMFRSSRILRKFLPPQFHEHLNFFSLKSIETMLEKAGFKMRLVREIDWPLPTGGVAKMGIVLANTKS